MYIKKFYSPGLEGATSDTIKIISTGPDISVSETPAPSTEMVATPAEPATPTEAQATPAQVTPAVTPAAQVITPTEVPVVKPEPAVTAAEALAIKDWKQNLKDVGFDDNDIKILEFRKATGSHKAAMEALTVDFKGMSTDDLMRLEFKEKFPTLTAGQVEKLLQRENVETYKLDEDKYDADDMELGKALKDAKGEEIRQKFIERQSKFAIPDRNVSAEQQAQQAEQQRMVEQETQMVRDTIVNSPTAQTLIKDRKFAIDYGGAQPFYFEVSNPQNNLDVLLDPQKGAQAVTVNGKPDAEKLLLASIAFTGDAKSLFSALINHGMTLGQQKFVTNDLENVQRVAEVTPPSGGLSWAEAWKTQGKTVKY